MDTSIERLEGKLDTSVERLETKMDAGFQKQGVQLEALQDGLKLALEGISGNRKVLDDKFAEVLEKLDERVLPVELASRQLARDLASIKPRLRAKRKKPV